jgi:hypothetical protein
MEAMKWAKASNESAIARYRGLETELFDNLWLAPQALRFRLPSQADSYSAFFDCSEVYAALKVFLQRRNRRSRNLGPK